MLSPSSCHSCVWLQASPLIFTLTTWPSPLSFKAHHLSLWIAIIFRWTLLWIIAHVESVPFKAKNVTKSIWLMITRQIYRSHLGKTPIGQYNVTKTSELLCSSIESINFWIFKLSHSNIIWVIHVIEFFTIRLNCAFLAHIYIRQVLVDPFKYN